MNRSIIFLLIFWTVAAPIRESQARELIHFTLTPTEFFDAVRDIGHGVLAEAINRLPTVDELMDLFKQIVTTSPIALPVAAINFLCGTLLGSHHVHPDTEIATDRLGFALFRGCDKIIVPLREASDLWNREEFDRNKSVVIFSGGFLTNVNVSQAIDVVAKAYICRGDSNFLAVDDYDYLDVLYMWSSVNAKKIGSLVGDALANLTEEHHIPLDRIHLVGHSLGAHIMSAAGGRYTEITGKRLKRITGLDPARPCFYNYGGLQGLYRGQAEFVDIIHTNPGYTGVDQSVGDVDFFVNGRSPVLPSCLESICSHLMANDIYAESVYPGNEYNFPSVRCSSLKDLNDGYCNGTSYPMGYALTSNIPEGNYFLNINKKAPYGKNASSDFNQLKGPCGRCEQEPEQPKHLFG